MKGKKKNKATGGSSQGISPSQSIKTRLIAVILALVAVPLIISIVVNYISSLREADENAETMNLQAAQIVEGKFVDVMDQNMTAMQIAADAEDCVRYLMGSDEEREALYDTTLTFLKDTDDVFGDGNSTALTDKSGQQLVRTSGELLNISDREYFKKAVSGTPYVSDVLQDKATGQFIMTMIVPVYNVQEYIRELLKIHVKSQQTRKEYMIKFNEDDNIRRYVQDGNIEEAKIYIKKIIEEI